MSQRKAVLDKSLASAFKTVLRRTPQKDPDHPKQSPISKPWPPVPGKTFDRLHQHYQPWMHEQSHDEKEAFEHYTKSDYGRINRHLRSGSPPHVDPLVKTDQAVGRHYAEQMDHAMDRAPTSPFPMELHRGIHTDTMFHPQHAKAMASLKPGDRIHEPGFLSMSTHPRTANFFGDYHLHIHAPAGSSVAPMFYKGEEEVLGHRGSVLHVHKIEHDAEGVTHIHADLLHRQAS